VRQVVRGRVKLIENGKMLKYGLYRGYDMFDLDAWLWHNTGRTVRIKIFDDRNHKLFDTEGKLKIDWNDGYLKYYIRHDKEIINLDAVLWNNVDDILSIRLEGFVIPNL
jgi:hypothetical protein